MLLIAIAKDRKWRHPTSGGMITLGQLHSLLCPRSRSGDVRPCWRDQSGSAHPESATSLGSRVVSLGHARLRGSVCSSSMNMMHGVVCASINGRRTIFGLLHAAPERKLRVLKIDTLQDGRSPVPSIPIRFRDVPVKADRVTIGNGWRPELPSYQDYWAGTLRRNGSLTAPGRSNPAAPSHCDVEQFDIVKVGV